MGKEGLFDERRGRWMDEEESSIKGEGQPIREPRWTDWNGEEEREIERLDIKLKMKKRLQLSYPFTLSLIPLHLQYLTTNSERNNWQFYWSNKIKTFRVIAMNNDSCYGYLAEVPTLSNRSTTSIRVINPNQANHFNLEKQMGIFTHEILKIADCVRNKAKIWYEITYDKNWILSISKEDSILKGRPE